jgi:hypothetical protein
LSGDAPAAATNPRWEPRTQLRSRTGSFLRIDASAWPLLVREVRKELPGSKQLTANSDVVADYSLINGDRLRRHRSLGGDDQVALLPAATTRRPRRREMGQPSTSMSVSSATNWACSFTASVVGFTRSRSFAYPSFVDTVRYLRLLGPYAPWRRGCP